MCSASTQNYGQRVAPSSPQNAYAVSDGLSRQYATASRQPPLPSDVCKRHRRQSCGVDPVPLQTVALAFSVLLSVSGCLLTVTLCYRWHADTNRQIGRFEAIVQKELRDLDAIVEMVRDELVSKRANAYKELQRKYDDGRNDYEDVDADEESDDDRFMGRSLSDNSWPSDGYRPNDEPSMLGPNEQRRRRRSLLMDIENNTVINDPEESQDEKPDKKLIPKESSTENTLKTNSYKPKFPASNKKKSMKQEDKDKNRSIFQDEDFQEPPGIVAAHYTSHASNYNMRTHKHYDGNGHVKHPDGDFRDWIEDTWNKTANKNSNYFQMQNGRVEFLKPGLYFVYAQVYYSDNHDTNGYCVKKNNINVICCITTRHHGTAPVNSCYTASVIYFNSKDILSIKGQDSERFIILDPLKTFFGLFKVSDD